MSAAVRGLWRRVAVAWGEVLATGAAFAILQRLDLVADVPLAIVVALLLVARGARDIHEATQHRWSNPRAWLHAGLALQVTGVTAVMYATGWGAALIGVGYPISLSDRALTHGAQAYRLGLRYAVVGVAVGQAGAATGLIPSELDLPLAHGLAALSTLGMVFLCKQLEATTRGRQLAQQEGEQREARFRALVQNGSDMVVILDSQGRMTYVSPTIALMGYSPEELIGRNGFDLVHPDDLDGARAVFAAVLDTPGTKATLELRARYADESWHWHEVVGQNLLHVGVVAGVVVNFRDITERKHAADALIEHAAQLEQANTVKDEFVATVSHELRTPLTSLTGVTKTIRQHWSRLDDEAKLRLLDSMERQADRLSRMVDDLLIMSRVVRADITASARSVDVRLAMREAIEMTDSGDELVTVRAPDELYAQVDPDHLNRILCNLVSNAHKYGAPPVTCTAAVVGDHVVVEVGDEGPGVPDDFVNDLFEKFTQQSAGDVRPTRGLGLGLSITRALVEANGGEISYRPNQPRGACFTVCLPRAHDDADAGAVDQSADQIRTGDPVGRVGTATPARPDA